MAKISALLFDLDGTIRDTKEIIYTAYQYALKTHTGKAPTEAELLPHVHHHTAVYEAFAADIDKEAFEATYFGKIRETMPSAGPYVGAHETIEALKQAGYKLAIVTTAKASIDYLKRQNIQKLFDAVVDGNDTSKHKPDPEPVLLALKKLGVKASEAAMIGDMRVDMQAAKNAKLAVVIGITHGFESREGLEKAGADYTIDSFQELIPLIDKL